MVVLCCIVVVTGFLPFPVSRSSLSSPPSQVLRNAAKGPGTHQNCITWSQFFRSPLWSGARHGGMGTETGVTQICVCARSIIIGPSTVTGGWKGFGKRGEVCRGALLAFGLWCRFIVIFLDTLLDSLQKATDFLKQINHQCLLCPWHGSVSQCFVHSKSESFNGLACDMPSELNARSMHSADVSLLRACNGSMSFGHQDLCPMHVYADCDILH